MGGLGRGGVEEGVKEGGGEEKVHSITFPLVAIPRQSLLDFQAVTAEDRKKKKKNSWRRKKRTKSENTASSPEHRRSVNSVSYSRSVAGG